MSRTSQDSLLSAAAGAPASSTSSAESGSPVVLTAEVLGATVLACCRRGWAVFPLIHGAKLPMRGSHGLRDATSDRAFVLGLFTGGARANARPGLFDLPDEAAQEAFVAAVADEQAETVERYRACTTDAEMIAVFTQRMRGLRVPNIGIRTGPESGLLVIDYDPRNDDARRLQWHTLLSLLGGFMVPTRLVSTRDNGLHMVFKWPRKLDAQPHRKKLSREPGGRAEFDAFDVKGRGGFIVAPPSIIAAQPAQPARPARNGRPAQDARSLLTGGCYNVVLDADPLPLPHALLARVFQRAAASGAGGSPSRIPGTVSSLLVHLSAEAGDLGVVGPLPDTPGNRAWLDGLMAFLLASLRGGKWPRDEWWKALGAIASTGWPDARSVAQRWSIADAVGWRESEFRTQWTSIIERAERLDITLKKYQWRGLRHDCWLTGHRGPYNPPDLPEGDRVVTLHAMTDAELVAELMSVPRTTLVDWVAHHPDRFRRIKPTLAQARKAARKRADPQAGS